MNLQKSDLLYEGKGKKVFRLEGEKNLLFIEFKDSLTAFNAQKIGSFAEKGSVGRNITSHIFRYLKTQGIRSHWVQDVGANSMICERLQMIPLEVVVRNYVAGSFAKKFGLKEGEKLAAPIVEFYFKNDALADPFISDEQALYLKTVKTQSDLESLKASARAVNGHLVKFFAAAKLNLIDFKLEYGLTGQGELCLGDEITPDSCRLWDVTTQKKLDKDRFRQDLGGVAEGYFEVLQRIQEIKEIE